VTSRSSRQEMLASAETLRPSPRILSRSMSLLRFQEELSFNTEAKKKKTD